MRTKSDRRSIRWLIPRTLFALLLVGQTNLAGAQQGSCDPALPRERLTLSVNAETFVEQQETVDARAICGDTVISIRRCAIIEIKRLKAQQFCFPEGRPAYFEFFDEIEYFEAPR